MSVKRIQAAAVSMIFAAALSGCSDKKDNSSETKSEKMVSPKTVTFDWQEPYKAKLEEFRSSAEYQESNGIAGGVARRPFA